MKEDKAAIRAWTKAQSRLGMREARPTILIGLVSTLASLGQAWCMAQIIAPALLTAPIPLWPLPVFGVLALLRALLSAASDISAAHAGMMARRRLRGEILGSILTAGPSLLRQTHSGELAALAVDRVEALDGFFGRWLPASVLWIAAPILFLIPVAVVQPRAALILGLCGLVVPFGQALFGIGAGLASRNQFLAMSRLQARFLDRIRGIATIVLAGRAEDEAARLGKAADELRQRTMKVLRVAFLSSATIDFTMILALVLIAVLDGRRAMALMNATDVTLDAALLPLVLHSLFALLLVPEFFAPFRALALAYQDRGHAQGAATAVQALPEPPETLTPPVVRTVEAHGVTIAFEHVSFAWDEARGKALDDVSFGVPAGETMVLAGQSGSGKSTIIELLLGFAKPDSGRITFNGADITTIVPDALARMTSWIGQKPMLFAGTLRDNILFAKPDASDEELEAALRAASVDRFLVSMPQGLDTWLGEGGFGLSGGQAQRIAIARAFLKNAPVLLLDEPTAHLDPATEADVFDSLRRLALRRTVVLASHSTSVHMFNGRRIDLAHGQVQTKQGVGQGVA